MYHMHQCTRLNFQIHEFMEKIHLILLNRIQAEHDHPLTQKLIEKRSLGSRGQGFKSNLAKKYLILTDSFKNT